MGRNAWSDPILISIRKEFSSVSASLESRCPPFRFILSLAVFLAVIISPSARCFAQEHAERTIDEIKTEAIHRAEVGQYPLIGLDAGDVREALNSVQTRDKDEWAAACMAVAERYIKGGKSLDKTYHVT